MTELEVLKYVKDEILKKTSKEVIFSILQGRGVPISEITKAYEKCLSIGPAILEESQLGQNDGLDFSKIVGMFFMALIFILGLIFIIYFSIWIYLILTGSDLALQIFDIIQVYIIKFTDKYGFLKSLFFFDFLTK